MQEPIEVKKYEYFNNVFKNIKENWNNYLIVMSQFSNRRSYIVDNHQSLSDPDIHLIITAQYWDIGI